MVDFCFSLVETEEVRNSLSVFTEEKHQFPQYLLGNRTALLLLAGSGLFHIAAGLSHATQSALDLQMGICGTPCSKLSLLYQVFLVLDQNFLLQLTICKLLYLVDGYKTVSF